MNKIKVTIVRNGKHYQGLYVVKGGTLTLTSPNIGGMKSAKESSNNDVLAELLLNELIDDHERSHLQEDILSTEKDKLLLEIEKKEAQLLRVSQESSCLNKGKYKNHPNANMSKIMVESIRKDIKSLNDKLAQITASNT